MMKNCISMRMAVPEDAEKLSEIYRPYVEKTAITFEYESPTADEFRERIESTLKTYPYIVLEEDGEPAGYAYAGILKGRAAFSWAVEASIYLKEGSEGKGYGRMLYEKLEEILAMQHIINVNVSIAYTDREKDEHLTMNSPEFHEHMGYMKNAHFYKCGYKFGKWYDLIWMEKYLGEHKDVPEPMIPIGQLHVEF